MQQMTHLYGFVEITNMNVAKHKGLPEIEKQAKRECAKLKKANPDTGYSYMIMGENGECLKREIYDE